MSPELGLDEELGGRQSLSSFQRLSLKGGAGEAASGTGLGAAQGDPTPPLSSFVFCQ